MKISIFLLSSLIGFFMVVKKVDSNPICNEKENENFLLEKRFAPRQEFIKGQTWRIVNEFMSALQQFQDRNLRAKSFGKVLRSYQYPSAI